MSINKNTQALADLLGVSRTSSASSAGNQNAAKAQFNALTANVDALTDREQANMERLAINLMVKGLVNNQAEAIDRARNEIVSARQQNDVRISGQRYQRLGWNN